MIRWLEQVCGSPEEIYIDLFYRHTLLEMALWGAYLVIGWTMLARLLCRHRTLRRMLNGAVWLAVVAVILWRTLGNRSSGAHSLSLAPFSFLSAGKTEPERYRSAMANFLMFIPYGMSAPFLLPDKLRHRAGIAVLSALLFSLCIELLQYRFGFGLCETDDLILNTFGAAIGALAFMLSRDRAYNRRNVG